MKNVDLEKLISSTTIIKAEDNLQRNNILGDSYVSRFSCNQGSQVDLSNLEDCWKNKWESFSHYWSKDRQGYRFLYDSFKMFYYSFEQLKLNKIRAINAVGDMNGTRHYNNLCGTNLYGVYHHGKKIIDLLVADLKLVKKDCKDYVFCKKFSESRNKFIEHNHNPRGIKFVLEPSIWSLFSTDSLLEVHVHTTREREFDVYIDYYEDYYCLENIIVSVIKNFYIVPKLQINSTAL